MVKALKLLMMILAQIDVVEGHENDDDLMTQRKDEEP
jgi:hypothetical protein